MKVFIANDHAVSNEKSVVVSVLKKLNLDITAIDLGTTNQERCSYSEYAIKLCKEISKNSGSKGILICGSGIGMSMAANRFKGIRASLCRSEEDAKLAREHNNANVLCLGIRHTPIDLVEKIITVWFKTEFEGGRHLDRINLFDQLGEDPKKL